MKRVTTGLWTTLYTFGMGEKERYKERMAALADKGQITVVYIANGYAFELWRYRIVIR